MYISKFRIENYKSFFDSGEIEFKSGINIIVGQNNSGKTALLEALSHKYDQILPLNIKAKPNAMPGLFYKGSFQTSNIKIKGSEISKILQDPIFDYFLANRELEKYNITKNGQIDVTQIEATISLEKKKPLSFQFGSYKETFDHTANFIIYSRESDGRYFEVSPEDFKFYHPKSSPAGTFGEMISEYVLDNIYKLDSERLSIGKCPINSSKELKSNAENLAEVLHSIKSTSSYLFQQYIDLVNKVIPSVKDIAIPTEPIGEVNGLWYQIKIWTSPIPLEQQLELTIPLSQCGTGVSQVLAILYIVLINKDQPKIIIIDEPNSFLHPGAAKKLIQILNKFPQHQYFISTHSPEILATAKPSTITRLKYVDGETIAESINPEQTKDLRETLNEIGVKFSDVFFSENILWVEGETEEKAFPLILETADELFDVAILPLVHTDDLKMRKSKGQKHAKLVFDIYNRLSGANALTPPFVAVILDKERSSPQELADLAKEFGDKLKFIPRIMYESYLLDAEAIAYVLNAEILKDADKVTVEQVTHWIKEQRTAKFLTKNDSSAEVLELTEWLEKVHAADLLEKLFSKLTDAKVTYRKTTHSVKITEWLLENKPEQLAELKDFLVNILSRETA